MHTFPEEVEGDPEPGRGGTEAGGNRPGGPLHVVLSFLLPPQWSLPPRPHLETTIGISLKPSLTLPVTCLALGSW